MTKEELKKEAEDWIGDYTSVPCSCMFLKYDYTNLVEAYVAGAEPREERIAELEAYNEKLLNGDIEKHNKIVELQRENEELKAVERMALYSKMSDQLAKAKKLLGNLLYVYQLGKNELATARIIAEAEQFLKEELQINLKKTM